LHHEPTHLPVEVQDPSEPEEKTLVLLKIENWLTVTIIVMALPFALIAWPELALWLPRQLGY